MRCPKCKTSTLKPTKLEDGLPVMGCNECEGHLVSLLYYRDWKERNILVENDSTIDPAAVVEMDSKSALSCPKCSKIMTKYSISGKHKNRLDLCSHCDDAWLDGHEWSLLKSLELAHSLPKVFTDHWQKDVRNEQIEARKIARLKAIVNDDDLAKAQETKDWLKKHSNKSAILQFIGSD